MLLYQDGNYLASDDHYFLEGKYALCVFAKFVKNDNSKIVLIY